MRSRVMLAKLFRLVLLVFAFGSGILLFDIITYQSSDANECVGDVCLQSRHLFNVDVNRTTSAPPLIRTPVLLLTYQRAGSSFLGQLMNNNPDALYWFEPGDGIYSHLYGTNAGWAIRDDITNFSNGTKKIQSENELDAVSDILYNIFQCNIQDIPVEVKIHSFLSYFNKEQKRLQPYRKCWGKVAKTLKTSQCRKILGKACPSRYGKDLPKSEECRVRLRMNHTLPKNITQKDDDKFKEYQTCIADVQEALMPCMQDLEQVCKNQRIVSMKTARISMRVVERLLIKLPDLKVVHYMRDPRSISLSRLKHPSFRGLYTKKSVAKTSQVFCQDALDDVKIKQQLKQKYPDTFLDLYFEEYAMFPTLTAHRVYSFIESTLPEEVRLWLHENTNGTGSYRTSRNSQSIVNDWKSKISKKDLEDVNKQCKPLFDIIEMDWTV